MEMVSPSRAQDYKAILPCASPPDALVSIFTNFPDQFYSENY